MQQLNLIDGPDGVVVILWDCGSQEPGSNPGPGPSNSSFSPYYDFQSCIYTYTPNGFHPLYELLDDLLFFDLVIFS